MGMLKLIKSYTLHMYSLSFVNYTSLKLYKYNTYYPFPQPREWRHLGNSYKHDFGCVNIKEFKFLVVMENNWWKYEMAFTWFIMNP